jgi:hypothetical protein
MMTMSHEPSAHAMAAATAAGSHYIGGGAASVWPTFPGHVGVGGGVGGGVADMHRYGGGVTTLRDSGGAAVHSGHGHMLLSSAQTLAQSPSPDASNHMDAGEPSPCPAFCPRSSALGGV